MFFKFLFSSGMMVETGSVVHVIPDEKCRLSWLKAVCVPDRRLLD